MIKISKEGNKKGSTKVKGPKEVVCATTDLTIAHLVHQSNSNLSQLRSLPSSLKFHQKKRLTSLQENNPLITIQIALHS